MEGILEENILDLIGSIAILIYIITFIRVFIFPNSYAKDEWGLITAASIGLINAVLVFLFSMASLYAICFYNHPLGEPVKLNTGTYLLIMSLTTFFVSARIQSFTLKYFIEHGFSTLKKMSVINRYQM